MESKRSSKIKEPLELNLGGAIGDRYRDVS